MSKEYVNEKGPADHDTYAAETATYGGPVEVKLQRQLKNRHIAMIR